jgi:hypothetical protein
MFCIVLCYFLHCCLFARIHSWLMVTADDALPGRQLQPRCLTQTFTACHATVLSVTVGFSSLYRSYVFLL